MAIRSDVIVIGGGIAGLTAGIAAARSGAAVQIVSASESTLRQASGLIDVLGYPGRGDHPVANPFAAIEELPARHPYRLLGEEAVRESLELFDDVVGDAYGGAHTELNALIPTQGGAVKPTARYPVVTAAGLASDGRDTLLVGFDAIPDFPAPLVAGRLRDADFPGTIRGETIDFPGDFQTDAKLTRYARALERNEDVETEHGPRPVREALGEAIRDCRTDEPRVGLPALLGVEHSHEVVNELGSRVGAEVFEVPMGPPSIPGMRLAGLLEDGLSQAGGQFHTSAPVVDYDASDRTIDRVVVDRNGTQVAYEADEFVLATGGLVGKGVTATRERVSESIFGCHVPHSTDRYDWFDDVAFGDHAFARFGVVADATLRPQRASGGPEFENLRAAGAVIGGYDFAAENSGAGVSITTGTAAGRRAGEAT